MRLFSAIMMATLPAVAGCATGNGEESKVKMSSDKPVDVAELELPDDSECQGLDVEVIETKNSSDDVIGRQEVVKLSDGSVIPHGKTTFYWDNGNPKLEFYNVCGIRHGTKRTWHMLGEKWSEGAYAYNRDHGAWTEWYPDGTISRQWTMDRGSWNGVYTEWWPNGLKRIEVEWVNGQKQGTEVKWSEEGEELLRVEYIDGVAQP
ncbi:MAG: toxin-antitoxin system YwqK family antitoxin [Planctomycetota bacterium]|jgi:hypothetical protein